MAEPTPRTDFLRQIVAADMDAGRYDQVVTRFPPEPNGYLHIGHAKAICLNFGIAEDFGGRYHLRFDDTNPETEEPQYVEAMQRDIRWLGFDWGPHLYYASDYFEEMYGAAETLIGKGLAYVDGASDEEVRASRGTVTEPGTPTPDRDRPVEENLDLFRKMRAGEFPDGRYVLRGRIDLSSPNMLLRDPVLYRIRHAEHYRTGNTWCIYPLYDFAHCLEDAIEGVTHSFCTLEFDNNRALYDWVLENVGYEEPRPHQYEFNRLKLEHTVVSKRKLLPLVRSGYLSGWDDPRMPTLAGIRRRGVPPEALRRFVDEVGVARADQWVDPVRLDHVVRDTLNPVAPRVMAVLDPLKVVLTDRDADDTELLDAPLYPHDVPREGTRQVPFGRELWIERSDFSEDPPRGFRRLVPGGEVRLRYGYVIRCEEAVRDAEGRVVELRCSHDRATRGGTTPEGRKVKGTVHWVAAHAALPAEIRLYDRLFRSSHPDTAADAEADPMEDLNPESLVVVEGWVEPWVAEADPRTRFQFERTGYFWRDPEDGRGNALVFNRIAPLKDGWSAKGGGEGTEGKGNTHEGSGPGATHSAPKTPRSGEGRPGGRSDPSEGGATTGGGDGGRSERDQLRAADAELETRRLRYVDAWNVGDSEADVLTGSRRVSDFFDAAVAEHDDAPAVASWMVNELRGALDGRTLEDVPFDGAGFARLVALVDRGTVSRRAAKDVLDVMVVEGGEPAEVVQRLGLERVADTGALEPVVEEVLARWPGKVAEYRAGRKALLGLFVGDVMKETGGAADPQTVRALLTARLESGS